MRPLILVLLLIFSSCTSEKRKEIKLSTSEKIADGVSRFVSREANCKNQKLMKNDLQEKLNEIFKVKSSSNKSVVGDIVKIACKLAIGKIAPKLFNKYVPQIKKYECDIDAKLEELAAQACDRIKL